MAEQADRARPVIGIAPDVTEPKPGSIRAVCTLAYAEAIHRAGGWPVVLPPSVEMLPDHLARCDGFVISGGDDARTEPFGAPTHAKATPVHPVRQAFDTALLDALLARSGTPTLGVCLGMQMMALVAGGRLDQHLPDTLATAADHSGNAVHGVRATESSGPIGELLRSLGPRAALPVTSSHRQAVVDPGRLRVAAMSDDGVIEAIDQPGAPFFVGVQWHPERTEDDRAGLEVFRRLVAAASLYAAGRCACG